MSSSRRLSLIQRLGIGQPRWQAAGSLAIVTGASSGIGRELTKRLTREGCRVIAVARRAERLDDLAAECGGLLTDPNLGDSQLGNSQRDVGPHGGGIIPIVGDVTSAATRETAFEQVRLHNNGRLDLLVNNAGIGGIGPFELADADRMRQIMEVNFFAPADWIRDALPMLRANADRGPVICNIGSVLGHRAVPDKSEYSASKFAIHGFSDSLRSELASDGIAVTLVSPSTTKSEFFDSLVGTKAGQVSKSIGSWPPERVAQAAYSAIRRRRSEVILSAGGKALVYADRAFPTLMNWILAR
ncbi:Short-chain dehydrogenase [Neorhodopirellula lusitana]|uniref:Short-chain dehydrogenase n=1 Tax=Neorhodopirellula lusitana TaxID=445327 RepID=A0ABY1QJV3_9BACT|nr:Short-chain dehydrogenase [Neorhodopirellula lusitana]